MKRMLSLFMAVVFSLSMAGFALATDEIPVVPAGIFPVEEEIVKTPVVDEDEKKIEKKAKKKSTKKSAKKTTKETTKKKKKVLAASVD